MKTFNPISSKDQVQDMIDLINYLDKSYYVTFNEAQKGAPQIVRTLKKLNYCERQFLLKRIEELKYT